MWIFNKETNPIPLFCMVCSNWKSKNWSTRGSPERLAGRTARSVSRGLSPVLPSARCGPVGACKPPALACLRVWNVRETQQTPPEVSSLKLYDFRYTFDPQHVNSSSSVWAFYTTAYCFYSRTKTGKKESQTLFLFKVCGPQEGIYLARRAPGGQLVPNS